MKKFYYFVLIIITILYIVGCSAFKSLSNDDVVNFVSSNLENRHRLLTKLNQDYENGIITKNDFYKEELSIYKKERKTYTNKLMNNIEDKELKDTINKIIIGLDYKIKSNEFAQNGDLSNTAQYIEESSKISYPAIITLKNKYNANFDETYINHIEKSIETFDESK